MSWARPGHAFPAHRPARLVRFDALLAGAGTMLGAGLFTGLAPAAATAGHWLLAGAVLAALIALCSAFSTTDHGRAAPRTGVGYRYTREQLGRWPGRVAGGIFLVGRLATAAALAGCFGDYVMPGSPVLAGIAVLVLSCAVEAAGFRPSRGLTRALAGLLFLAVLALVTVCLLSPPGLPAMVNQPSSVDNAGELLPVAGVMFFGFLGFERVTMPDLDQPGLSRRALLLVVPALIGLVLGAYLLVGAAVLHQLGPVRLATARTPLTDALAAAGAAGLAPLASLAAATATAAGLLTVVGGTRRAIEAMGVSGDVPATATTPGHGRLAPPAAAVVGLGAALGLLILGPAPALVLAAGCALAYYAFTNAAARLLPAEGRLWPARSACFGLGLCVLVGLTMPAPDLLGVLAAMLAGALLPALAPASRRVRRYFRACD